MVKSATMAKETRIHQNKQPIRRHFIAEWMEEKDISPVELLELLNDPDRSSEYPEIDKSQVYRWLKGQLPQPAMQKRIAAALGFDDDPGALLRPPEMDWISEFFKERSLDELQKIRTVLETAFPRVASGGSGISERVASLSEKHQQVAREIAETSAARSGRSRKRGTQGN